jgi:hypothetical protein
MIERRTVLKGGVAAAGILGGVASSETPQGVDRAFADALQPGLPQQIQTAIERFRETIPPNFDHDYVEKAVIPFFLTSFYEDQQPMLPMIGVNFSKEPRTGRDGLFARPREAWPQQSSEADLLLGRDAGPLQADVQSQSRRFL